MNESLNGEEDLILGGFYLGVYNVKKMNENGKLREATCKHFGVILRRCKRHRQQNGTGISNQGQHRQQK